jgi:hypothetical protein
VEVGSASAGETGLPAFGSVIFSLGSTPENAGISAHISILFTKLPEEADGAVAPPPLPPGGEEGEASEAQTGPTAPPPLPPGGEEGEASEAQPGPEAGGKGKEPMQVYTPSLGPAPLGFTEESWRARWEGVEEGQGWARVVEDKSLCEEAEAHLAGLRPPSAHSQD